MKRTRVTLKFSPQEFDALKDDFYRLECKLRVIGHMDLQSISDEVSYGHFLCVHEVCQELQAVLQRMEASMPPRHP